MMLSTNHGVFDKVRGQMVGCTDFITKPVESHDLIEKVRQHAPLPTIQPNTSDLVEV
jgi:DNA-binding response OmpR family regulator